MEYFQHCCHPDPPENCQLNVKKIARKLLIFSQKLPFNRKNCQKIAIFFPKFPNDNNIKMKFQIP